MIRGEIYIIGVDGGGALEEDARKALLNSEVVLASKRLQSVFSGYPEFPLIKKKLKLIEKVDDSVSFLRKNRKRVSVLATGDPLFFGIGRRIINVITDREVKMFPALSSMQLAMARINEPWEDVFFLSLHGNKKRDWDMEDLPLLCELHKKLLILTGGGNTGRVVASLPPSANVHIFEKLGYKDERIRKGSAGDFTKTRFKEPNLIFVKPSVSETKIFGLCEKDFSHSRGLITKDEIRAVIMHKLELPARGIFWDIGAGSGSVAIEAKKMSPAIEVYAIEKDKAQLKHIKINIKNLNAGKIHMIPGEAPKVLTSLPMPDRVFIGGSGGVLKEIISSIARVMEEGIIVIAAVTLESLSEGRSALSKYGFQTELSQVSVSRLEPLGEKEYMKGLNPVFILKGKR